MGNEHFKQNVDKNKLPTSFKIEWYRANKEYMDGRKQNAIYDR